MSMFENIYLYTGGQDIGQVASRLAAAINGELTHHRGEVVVGRRLSIDPNAWVSGKVGRNTFYEDPPSSEHPEVMSLYDVSYDVWAPTPEDVQIHEASLIFNYIIAKLNWPALLTHNGDLLVTAWAPALGRTDFPPGTSSYADGQKLWSPYADPAAVAAPESGTGGRPPS